MKAKLVYIICYLIGAILIRLEGGIFQTFSGPGVFICLMPKENWKYFFRKNFYFLPLLPGVWKIAKTHYKPKNENHRMGLFDSSNEAFWCTDYNAKNRQSGTTQHGGRKVGNTKKSGKHPTFYHPEPRPTTPATYVGHINVFIPKLKY